MLWRSGCLTPRSSRRHLKYRNSGERSMSRKGTRKNGCTVPSSWSSRKGMLPPSSRCWLLKWQTMVVAEGSRSGGYGGGLLGSGQYPDSGSLHPATHHLALVLPATWQPPAAQTPALAPLTASQLPASQPPVLAPGPRQQAWEEALHQVQWPGSLPLILSGFPCHPGCPPGLIPPIPLPAI